ncbi:hypothetical protein [endosymbiont GvMRE of Glomus versiforme]|uniref:hypothetical protein n=1 Tax=endosymbiont GvMRE of Glomus versiforme TaxID=2039283 RepID=UPI000EC4A7BB|nr:hypothetical protein [endosymbiont GvMRE of Glomus versiforme]RHZ37139.1 hypothetical protein GvMRE_I1g56 [endosymbiont GvMRE of Glomus versiforme]
MNGIHWTYKEGIEIGWGWEEKGKIDWFAYKGNSEETKEIKEEIHKFKSGKDYSYTPSGKIEKWMDGECEKYTIHNQELKKKLWEITNEENEIEIEMAEIPKIPKLEPISPIEPIKPIEPIEPIKPIRPIGKRKNNEKWKEYDEKMKQYQEKMKTYAERMKEYGQRMQEYHRKMAEYTKKLAEKFGKKSLSENNKVSRNQTEYKKKVCPNCLDKGQYRVQPGDNFCRNCETQLIDIERSKLILEKNQWKWREFCVGISMTLILSGLVFLLVKLFKKKK